MNFGSYKIQTNKEPPQLQGYSMEPSLVGQPTANTPLHIPLIRSFQPMIALHIPERDIQLAPQEPQLRLRVFAVVEECAPIICKCIIPKPRRLTSPTTTLSEHS